MRRRFTAALVSRLSALLIVLVVGALLVESAGYQQPIAEAQYDSSAPASLRPGAAGGGGLVPRLAGADGGFTVAAGPIAEFFTRRGGVRTFGPPISEPFLLLGQTVQLFRNFGLRQNADGTVSTLNLLGLGVLPGRRAAGRTYPAVDPVLAQAAPPPDAPDFITPSQEFIRLHAPDSWEGLEVGFYRAFRESVKLAEAFPDRAGSPALLPVLAQEVWGLPVAGPTRDPADPGLVHLRWERGVMTYDQRTGLVETVPLGAFFKALLTGEGLPADLAADAQDSAYARQLDPSAPNGVARPAELPDTLLQSAFVPTAPTIWTGLAETDTGPPASPPPPAASEPAPVAAAPAAPPPPTPTPTPEADSCHGDEEITAAPEKPRTNVDVLIAVSSSRPYRYPRLAGTERTTFVQSRAGQLGYVYEWTVTPTQVGKHEYVFYIDSTIPCGKITLDVRGPLVTATPTISGTDQPDLSLSLTDAPDPGKVGQPVTYALSVTNVGSGTAGGSKLSFAISGSGTINSVGTTLGSCSQSGSSVSCNFGKFSAGGLAVVTVAVTPSAEGTLVATASVSSDDRDATTGNNAASQTTDVKK